MNQQFEWLCQCGGAGTAATFQRAYDLAACHVMETLHNRITIVEKSDFDAIVDSIIEEAEAIVSEG